MFKYTFIIILLSFIDTEIYGQKERLVVNYYANKSVFSKGKMKNEKMTGEWTYYYENGKIKSIEHYVNGKQDAKYIEYYLNGVVKIKGNYSCKCFREVKSKDTLDDGEIIELTTGLSCKVGDWEYFDENGKCIKVEKYDKDKLITGK